MPKPIRMSLKSGGFLSEKEGDVVATFKLKGKQYKSSPVGFFLFNPESSYVYMGFDSNSDGVVAANNQEAVARYTLQLNPFDEEFKESKKLADRFSNKKMKAKLKFGSENIYGRISPNATLFGEALASPSKI